MQAQERYIGEIFQTGYTFCPRGSVETNGQLLQITDHAALYSLIGTRYGGDGRTNFALPDMRGRVPVHAGQGYGLTERVVGQKIGSETRIVSLEAMAPHNHSPRMRVSENGATSTEPTGAYFAQATGPTYVQQTGTTFFELADDAITSSDVGASLEVPNVQPVQVNRFCIAMRGIFPQRD